MFLKKFRNFTIRQKLNVMITLTSFIVLLIVAATFVSQDRKRYKKDLENNAISTASIAAKNVKAALAFMDSERASETLKSLGTLPNLIHAKVWDQNNMLFAEHQAVIENKNNSSLPDISKRVITNSDSILVTLPILLDNESIGTLQLKLDLSPLDTRFLQSLKLSAGLLVLATGIALFISNLAQNIFTSRILKLHSAVKSVESSREYNIHIDSGKEEDEIGTLIDGFNSMIEEISERDNDLKLANEQLETRVEERTAELKKMAEAANMANHAKTEFLAMMSHELRTPLNPIVALSDQMLSEDINDDQKESLELILQSGHTLTQLIEDILDISRIEAHKLSLDYTVCQISEIIDHVTNTLSVKAEGKDIALNAEIDPSVPEVIYTDPKRLRQILFNLVGNAIKFTPNGYVRISLKHKIESDGSGILSASVKDTGIGIAEKDAKNIFDPFKQADNSISRRYGGAGLGLSICKQFIQLMGGDISCESKQGEGSTFNFHIKLPALPSSELLPDNPKEEKELIANDSKPTQDDELSSDAHILVAEDDNGNRMIMQKILNQMGLACDYVNNGAEAVKAANNKDYALIFMDGHMPVMDGIEATRQIRQLQKNRSREERTFIVALTANAMKGDREIYIDAGMDDYIAKPYTASDIRRILKSYLA